MPYPPKDGGAQLVHYTSRGLIAHGIDLSVLSVNPLRCFVPPESLPENYVSDCNFKCVRVDTRLHPLRMITNLFGSESYFIDRFRSADFESALIALLKEKDFDIVQIEHLYLCRYVSVIRRWSRAAIVFRPQNVEHEIWERYLRNLREPVRRVLLRTAVRRLKKFEGRVPGTVDGIIALTPDDAAFFRSASDRTPVETIPMGYDYEKLKDYDPEEQYRYPLSVYHLGSMEWLPNEEAVWWLIRKVLPVLEEKMFSGKIHIAGRNMPGRIFRYKSDMLKITAEVNDPLDFQKDKQIMIVPLWSGSGIRAKIIEGLALGKTIISTSVGAQGIRYDDGKNLLIADTPEAFASHIVRCAENPALCREMGRQAAMLGRSRYDYFLNAGGMITFYQQIMNAHV